MNIREEMRTESVRPEDQLLDILEENVKNEKQVRRMLQLFVEYGKGTENQDRNYLKWRAFKDVVEVMAGEQFSKVWWTTCYEAFAQVNFDK